MRLLRLARLPVELEGVDAAGLTRKLQRGRNRGGVVGLDARGEIGVLYGDLADGGGGELLHAYVLAFPRGVGLALDK